MKYTNESWIKKAKSKYGNRFSYEKTNYINSYHKVKIKCKKHNIYFEVPPISFIRESSKGNFCPECKHNKKLSSKEFFKKIKDNWGDLYSFDKTIFKTTRDNIIITCPDHGEFSKRAGLVSCEPVRILCPKCISEMDISGVNLVKCLNNNPLKANQDGVFYRAIMIHKPSKFKFLKIGVTSYTTYIRYKGFQYRDFDITILDEVYDTMLNVAIMEENFKLNTKLERFFIPKDIKFHGRTECYVVDKEIQLKADQVKFIRESILLKQNGVCALCKNIPKMPTLDHFHSKRHNGSGLVRGVLCNSCNRFLGVVENNLLRNGIDFSDMPEYLRSISSYVKEKHYPYIHPSEKKKPKKLKKSSYNALKRVYNGKAKFPIYPKSKMLIKPLKILYDRFNIIPEFYA